jgi:hypothetical protein
MHARGAGHVEAELSLEGVNDGNDHQAHIQDARPQSLDSYNSIKASNCHYELLSLRWIQFCCKNDIEGTPQPEPWNNSSLTHVAHGLPSVHASLRRLPELESQLHHEQGTARQRLGRI